MNGFVDLRSNTADDNHHGGFWPSFTDIMMVVVMIFMLASVALILRNWELVEALRNTMEAERQAEAFARDVTATNATLEEQLAQVQHQLSELRMQAMQLKEEGARQRELAVQREQLRLQLEKQLQQSEAAHEQEGERNRELSARLLSEQEKLRVLHEEHAKQAADLLEVQRQYGDLQVVHQNQTDALSALQQQREKDEKSLLSLQGEFDTLKVKYDKLIKPARTAVGKYVVDVRYEKRDGKGWIRFKDNGDEGYTTVTLKVLHQRLAALKKAHPRKLYIKIIIPPDSGLSYNEAWGFMRSLLDKYDYYYQS